MPGPFPTLSADGRYPTGWPGVSAVTAESLAAIAPRLASAKGEVWLLLRGYWIYDPDGIVRRFFDAGYCCQPLYLPANRYFFLLRLIPLEPADKVDCITCDDDSYYPWERPDIGMIGLVDPGSGLID